jgi:hypothetical protein
MPKSDRQSNEPHAGWGALRAKLAALLAQLRSCPDQTATRCAFSRRLPQKMANLGYRPSMLEPMYVLKSQLEALNNSRHEGHRLPNPPQTAFASSQQLAQNTLNRALPNHCSEDAP